MNLSRDDSLALNFWQRLQFRAESSDTAPADRADAWRRLLVQLQTVQKSGKISGQLYSRLLQQFAIKYCQVVDSQESGKGLNNYAEAVLALASGRRNESQNWKSSLSMESIQELSVYKDLVAAKANQSLLRGPLEDKTQEQNDPLQCKVSANLPARDNSYDQRSSINANSENTSNVSMMRQDFGDKVSTSATSSSYSNKLRMSGMNEGGARTAPHTTDAPMSRRMFCGNATDKVVGGSRLGNGNFGIVERSTKASLDTQHLTANTGLKRKAPSHSSGENSTNQVRRSQNSGRRDLYIPFRDDRGASCSANYNENLSTHTSSFQFCQPQRDQRTTLSRNQDNSDVAVSYGDNKGRRKTSDKQTPSDEEEQESSTSADFMTAKQKFMIDSNKKNQRQRGEASSSRQGAINNTSYGSTRKTLGTRRGPSRQFIPPVLNRSCDDDESERSASGYLGNSRRNPGDRKSPGDEPEVDERLKNIEPKMVELITNEIMDHGPPLSWDDIAGLEFAKNVIKEIVVWPMLRPDIFKGLRGPPKGILLFGPPGTGKTLIGKCIASQSKATFFSISASSLTSKWVGEGEKMVRALFAVARCHLPAVIFIDEIDSLLSQRTDGEHDASRRIKTEFLVQLDGATTNSDERLLVVGATNRPQEIDEAARRRLVKRLYIPLPEAGARQQIMYNLLSQQRCDITEQEVSQIVTQTDGYSGSDMANLCREAALGPIRSITDIQCIDADQVRPITFEDFRSALHQVRASVSEKDLDLYVQWNTLYGSGMK